MVRPGLRLRARGEASVDVVWERYARLELWPTWSPQIRRVEPDGARLRSGLEGVVHGPVGVAARFVVTDVDEDARTWRWRVRPALGRFVTVPITLELDHVVRARGAGSETALRVSGPPLAAPLVLGYAPLARFALGRLVRP